jgi:hypothetical protein
MAPNRKNKRSESEALSRETEAAPRNGPPIPDPLGDDERVVASGRLTTKSPDREGLLGSGSEPLPDGGVEQHPTHDADLEDLGPDAYEALTDAPETGFLRREDEEQPEEETEDEDEEEGEEIEKSR